MNRCPFQYTFQYCISECAIDWLIPTDLHTFPYYEFESMAAAADGSTIVSVQERPKEPHFGLAIWRPHTATHGSLVPRLLGYEANTWLVRCSAWCMPSLKGVGGPLSE